MSCGSKDDRDKASGTESQDRPEPGEVWLGVEGSDGIVGGFPSDIGLATNDHYKCCRKIAGAVDPCVRKSIRR